MTTERHTTIASSASPIRGWKATRNMKCRDMEYEVGKTYYLSPGESLELCYNGFHFCQTQQDVLGYYAYDSKFVLLEVEAFGKVITRRDKSVAERIKIVRVVPRDEWQFLQDNTIFYVDPDGVPAYSYRKPLDSDGNVVYTWRL